MRFSRVVLPEPLGPIRPRISPRDRVSETSRTAATPPKDLEICATARRAAATWNPSTRRTGTALAAIPRAQHGPHVGHRLHRRIDHDRRVLPERPFERLTELLRVLGAAAGRAERLREANEVRVEQIRRDVAAAETVLLNSLDVAVGAVVEDDRDDVQPVAHGRRE